MAIKQNTSLWKKWKESIKLNDTFIDSSIVAFERIFIQRRLITTTFENIANNQPRKSKFIYSYIILSILIILALRSLLFFYFKINDNNIGLIWMGDYCRVLGTLGDIFHSWWIGFSALSGLLRFVTIQYESTGQLYYITDLNHFITGNNRIETTGLNMFYLQKLKVRTKIFLLFAKMIH